MQLLPFLKYDFSYFMIPFTKKIHVDKKNYSETFATKENTTKYTIIIFLFLHSKFINYATEEPFWVLQRTFQWAVLKITIFVLMWIIF